MNINHCNQTNFCGIFYNQTGLKYVEKENGTDAIAKLQNAQQKFANSKWTMNINENGYTLVSPSTSKTYTGPFSIRKHSKMGALKTKVSQLIIRMDASNKSKYIVNFPDMTGVSKMYKAIKNASGLERMLLILTVLEKNI